MKKYGLQPQKLTKQRSKLLCKKAGSTHQESLQDYKLGGWTHSAPKKKK